MELVLGTQPACAVSLGKGGRSEDAAVSLEAFLCDVEARAFRIAVVQLRDRDEALDVVQDAMIRLARRYGHAPCAEWAPLFYRILQNRIRDWHRRRAVRNRVLAFFGGLPGDAGGEPDPLLGAAGPPADNPHEHAARDGAIAALERALAQLPPRQREAFLLRNLEGLDVAETAVAMRCSEGSVKTHYFRAVRRLRELLGEHW